MSNSYKKLSELLGSSLSGSLSSSSSSSSSSSASDALFKALLSSNATFTPPISSSQFIKENLYFRNKPIYIDGYTFKNCRFDRCGLITMKGNFKFVNCVFDNDTKVEYKGNALNIIKLYNRTEQKRVSHLSPTENPDGTVTI